MFELLATGYTNVLWAVASVLGIEKNTLKSVTDPGTFLSGALAGGMARAFVLPLDRGGQKGIARTVFRRMPQAGCLMLFYTTSAAQMLPGTEKDPARKMASTFLVASMAGFNMRLLCNPITRVGDESLRTGDSPLHTIRKFRSKTILQFWYCAPNLFANALYFGLLLTTFEGLRRFSERNFVSIRKEKAVASREATHGGKIEGSPYMPKDLVNTSNYIPVATTNAICGGIAAAFASTVCYPYSASRYMQTVIHESALCRGLRSTLLKEVPFIAITFGTFSLLQPIFSPQHGARCGFGY